MTRLLFMFGILLCVTGCGQAAFAGPVPPPTTPDLDASTLGYFATFATGAYVAVKRFVAKKGTR